MSTFSPQDVKHVARLAAIPITEDEEKKLSQGFTKTLEVIDHLNEIDTIGVEPTHQVTGLSNVFREDVVDEKRMFSQEKALMNAKRTYNGFFVVDQVLEE